MAKFYGQIGFVKTVESPADSGIWVEDKCERDYYGDVNRIVRHWDSVQKVNDDVSVNNEISILSDPYVTENIPWIKYVVEVQYPRLILSIGGVYNG